MFCIHKSFKSELQFCILFLKGNWAYKTNLFICIKNLKPKNAILSKGIFLANCVNTANFLIIWCPYLSRVGESLSLCILKTTNFRLYVKQNVPTYGALSTKNFCSKSNTFWDISSQSFQIGSGTPCILSPKGFKNSLRVFKKDRRVSKEIQIVPLRGLSGALRGSRGCSGSFRSSQRTQRVSKGPSRYFRSSHTFLKAFSRLSGTWRGPSDALGGL